MTKALLLRPLAGRADRAALPRRRARRVGSGPVGSGGLIFLALLEKTEPIDIPAIVRVLIPDSGLDKFNSVISLVQMFIEPGDPANCGRVLGASGLQIYQSEGIVDHFAPHEGIEAFAVFMGLVPIVPNLRGVPGLAAHGIQAKTAPTTGNVFVQYDAGPHGEGHFVVFDVPAAERQSAEYLGNLARTGTGTLVP